MNAHQDFMQLQKQLAEHLRSPSTAAPPAGMDARRLAVYRRLFFNNIRNYLGQVFPILMQTLQADQWEELCRNFYARHRCDTPQFFRVAEAFLDFLGSDPAPCSDPPAYLLELAHFEWVELDVAIAEGPMPSDADPDADLLRSRPVLNPHLRNLSYRYPVHRFQQEPQARHAAEEQVFLAVYRHPQSGEVCWSQLSAASAQLLHLLQNNPQLSGEAALQQLGASNDKQAWQQFGARSLAQMRELGLILGGR